MIRTGIGYDVHQFTEGRKLILGGVEIPHTKGLDGHSDADVLCHAIADSILGALGLPDIGHYFPPGEKFCKDISSLKILEKCRELSEEHGFEISNIDSALIAEAPKVLPHAAEMKEHIAKSLGIATSQIGIKATTNEKMGFVGREEGIAALSSSLLVSREISQHFASLKNSSLPNPDIPEKSSPLVSRESPPPETLHSLNPTQPITQTRSNLPHWSQENAAHFITWRTHDSIPEPVFQRWLDERSHWLSAHKLHLNDPNLAEKNSSVAKE